MLSSNSCSKQVLLNEHRIIARSQDFKSGDPDLRKGLEGTRQGPRGQPSQQTIDLLSGCGNKLENQPKLKMVFKSEDSCVSGPRASTG